MSKVGQRTPAQQMSEVIDLASRRALKSDNRDTAAVELPIDFGYEMPPHLNMSKRGGLQAARSDARDAQEKALKEVVQFVSRPENFFAFAQALDRLGQEWRSNEQRMRIMALINQLKALKGENTPFMGVSSLSVPPFTLGSPGDAADVENGPADTILPRPMSLAYVDDDGNEQKLVINRELGYREMLIQARLAVLIVVAVYARRNGVEIADGPVLLRLLAALDGTEHDEPAFAHRSHSFQKRPLDIRVDHRIFSISADRYTIDSGA